MGYRGTEKQNLISPKAKLTNKPSKSLAAELMNVLESHGTGVEFKSNV